MINYNADHDDITPYTPAKKYQVSMVIVSMSVSRHLYTPQSSYLPYLGLFFQVYFCPELRECEMQNL